jgi:hypothetical protein
MGQSTSLCPLSCHAGSRTVPRVHRPTPGLVHPDLQRGICPLRFDQVDCDVQVNLSHAVHEARDNPRGEHLGLIAFQESFQGLDLGDCVNPSVYVGRLHSEPPSSALLPRSIQCGGSRSDQSKEDGSGTIRGESTHPASLRSPRAIRRSSGDRHEPQPRVTLTAVKSEIFHNSSITLTMSGSVGASHQVRCSSRLCTKEMSLNPLRSRQAVN